MGYFDTNYKRGRNRKAKKFWPSYKSRISILHEPNDLRGSLMQEANQRAEVLRLKPTEAEKVFITSLKGHGVDFIFNWVCALSRSKYRIVDFYLPKLKWIVEIDGGYHDDAKVKSYDDWKDQSSKWKTFRYTNDEVMLRSDFIASEFKRIINKMSRGFHSSIPLNQRRY